MDAQAIRATLVEVLQEIQAASGQECPALVGTVKPVDDLAGFDSKIWPVATGMLAAKLGITIANDVNIFRKEKACVAVTIDESVAMVLAMTAAARLRADSALAVAK
jgi:hypothetical protein